MSDTHLSIENVTKSFGTVHALDDVSLNVDRGSFVCLLGPSGCGKTTLLRIIAGFETASAGSLTLDGKSITGQPAHHRGFGMVFQSLALFPHMTVAQNIAYGLKLRKASRAEQGQRVEELLEVIELPGIADRPVSALSGGQRQRVAIARALAIRPSLFLLDEPLSALDAKLRENMQIELRRLQQKFGVTTILVTHDQAEAMMLADELVVMKDGRIRQTGKPTDVYRKPADRFVADFLGSANLVDARVGPGGKLVFLGAQTGHVAPFSENAKVSVAVRPEDVRLSLPGTSDTPVNSAIAAQVVFRRDLGAVSEWILSVGDVEIRARCPRNQNPDASVGDEVAVDIDFEDCQIYAG